MTAREISRELTYSEYTVIEYPHVVLKFLPVGVLNIYGEGNKPIKHSYTVYHRGEDFILSTAPHIMNTPSEMRIAIMKNHLTLYSLLNNEKGEPLETLHCNKVKFKTYDRTTENN